MNRVTPLVEYNINTNNIKIRIIMFIIFFNLNNV